MHYVSGPYLQTHIIGPYSYIAMRPTSCIVGRRAWYYRGVHYYIGGGVHYYYYYYYIPPICRYAYTIIYILYITMHILLYTYYIILVL